MMSPVESFFAICGLMFLVAIGLRIWDYFVAKKARGRKAPESATTVR